MELGRILLYSADELCRYVASKLKYDSVCYSSSKLQWSGGIFRCLNGMDCYLLFPVVSVRLLMVSEHRWLTLVGKLIRHSMGLLHGIQGCLLHAICIGPTVTKLPVLFQPYLLQVMYMTFQYLTVSCIPATGHVHDISIPDSFMYTYYRSCI